MRTQVLRKANSLLVVHHQAVGMQFFHRLSSQDIDVDTLAHFAQNPRHQFSIAMLTAEFPIDASFEVSTENNGGLKFRLLAS